MEFSLSTTFYLLLLFMPLLFVVAANIVKSLKVKNRLLALAGVILLFTWFDFYQSCTPEAIASAKNARVVLALGLIYRIYTKYTYIVAVLMLLAVIRVIIQTQFRKEIVFNLLFALFLLSIPTIMKIIS